jgi:hypothetical protein
MNEIQEQERLDMARVKEIYDDALAAIVSPAMPILIHIKRSDALRLPARIIQEHRDKILHDIAISVYAIESGKSPSNYLASLYIDSGNESIVICEEYVIKHYELPGLLEKSYKVEIKSDFSQRINK